MKVAVTGGAGFIGHHLVASLLAGGCSVTILDNLRRGSFERQGVHGSTCVEGDIRDRADCDRAFAGADAVVHLAAQANVMGTQADPDYAFDTNVAGTWNVARAAREAGVRHLIFASSREVYGDAEALPVPETAALAPRNLYGASKVAGEVLLRHGAAELPVSVLRLSNVIGSGDSDRVIPLWLRAGRDGQPIDIFGGTQLLDLVPVGFVCEAVSQLLRLGPQPQPINVGSGSATPITELARHVVALTGSRSQLRLLPARGPEVSRFRADVRLLRSQLGLVPPADPLACIEVDW